MAQDYADTLKQQLKDADRTLDAHDGELKRQYGMFGEKPLRNNAEHKRMQARSTELTDHRDTLQRELREESDRVDAARRAQYEAEIAREQQEADLARAQAEWQFRVSAQQRSTGSRKPNSGGTGAVGGSIILGLAALFVVLWIASMLIDPIMYTGPALLPIGVVGLLKLSASRVRWARVALGIGVMSVVFWTIELSGSNSGWMSLLAVLSFPAAIVLAARVPAPSQRPVAGT